jgi:ligand-binding SRPBCC domain-containing protein
MGKFESDVVVQCPVETAFDFFNRPANLPRLSPETMPMEVLSAPEVLAADSVIKIKVKQWGIAQHIEARVVEYQPPVGFADEQVKGPFAKWRHTHRFESVGDGATRVTDLVEFEPPGGLLALLLTEKRILEQLKQVFAERRARLREILEGNGRVGE